MYRLRWAMSQRAGARCSHDERLSLNLGLGKRAGALQPRGRGAAHEPGERPSWNLLHVFVALINSSEKGDETMKEILIDPITRLEGHGNISIFLNDAGEVENAYLKIPELRGFEQFCVGRRAELMPILTTRICGVCPVAHHLAAAKALDAAFNVEPPSAAKKLRELMYAAYYIYDHTLHFYYLGGPDFVVGPDAPPEKRNIIGVIEKAGLDVGKEVIKHRAYGQKITEIIGGKATHPVCGLPGGISKPLSEENRAEIERMVESCVKFAQFTLKLFHDIVLGNSKYVDLRS